MKKLYLLLAFLCFFIVLNAQVSRTVEVTAGNLGTLLTATELSTITDLTLTGTIDARDFRTMRNAMPVLSVLDISGTTITEYSPLYPANTIPGNPFDVPFAESYSLLEKTTITSVVLPSTVTEIGQYAFMGCTNLASINFPEGLLSIGRAAFFSCTSLTSVELPSSLTTMGWQVFERCSNLTFVRLPSNLKVIEISTFSDCTSLVTIDIPSQVTTIGEAAFSGCSNLQSLELPSTLENIGNLSFYRCSSLSAVDLPLSLISIGREAFYECTSLETINIPRNVKTIGQMAFYGCTLLTSIYSYPVYPVDLGPDFTDVFGNIDRSKCVLYVPEGSRESYATADQWRDFGTITELPGITFSTTTITLNNQETTASFDMATQLNWEASTDQSWLTVAPLSGTGSQQISVVAQENTSSTTRRATIVFSVSESIQYEITVIQKGLPLTVHLDTPGTFNQQLTSDQLSTLSELTITGSIDTRDFVIIRDQMPLLEVLDLRGASIRAYSGAGGTFPFMETWDYPADKLPDCALQGSLLTTLYLSETCTSVGREALFNCIGLKEVIFPPSVVNIDFRAFGGCNSLVNVSMSSVITIDANAFEECKQLTNIDMPAVTLIEYGAFYGCDQLSSVSLPLLTRIGPEAFSMCYNLRSVELGNSLITIEKEAFFECNNLESIIIPPSVKKIGSAAFAFCSSMSLLSIPASVDTIEFHAFSYCSSLMKVYSYRAVPVVLQENSSVFLDSNTTNNTLYVPFGSKELYANAEGWKDFLNIVEMEGFQLSSTELTFGAGQLEKSIDITCNTAWTAVCDQEWLTVSPASGNASQTVTITALENSTTQRTGILTFTDAGGYSKAVHVTQQAMINSIPEANAGPDQRVEEGETVQLDGSASTDVDDEMLTYEWSAPEGITLSDVNTANPTFTAPPTERDTALTFTLVVNDGQENSASDKVIITVTNKVIELGVSVHEIDFESRESSAKVIITGNAQWTATSDQDWLIVTPSSGEGAKEIQLSAPANETITERTAIVTISAPEAADETITITQRGLVTTINQVISPAEIALYPNPFIQELTIEIKNPSLKATTVEIYSISGQKIKTLAKAQKGTKISLTWNGSDDQGKQVPEGMYLLKMNGETRKVLKGL